MEMPNPTLLYRLGKLNFIVDKKNLGTIIYASLRCGFRVLGFWS